MQLNDDAHDWKEDLARGHISTAVLLLLQKWRQEHSDFKAIDLQKDMQELESIFWFDTLPKVCASIFEHTDKAQRALDSLTCIENSAPLQQFIERNRRAAEAALSEQRRSVEFLKALESEAQV